MSGFFSLIFELNFRTAFWRLHSKAIQYYQQCNNYEKLAECYYRLQMFSELTSLAAEVGVGTTDVWFCCF